MEKCGEDFLPSPLASKPEFGLKGQYMEVRGLLTAVAIAVENDHTIAFLGNDQGEVSKVRPPCPRYLPFTIHCLGF